MNEDGACECGTDTDTDTFGLRAKLGPQTSRRRSRKFGLRAKLGPESLEEESTLAPTWQLNSHVLMKFLCCIMMMFA